MICPPDGLERAATDYPTNRTSRAKAPIMFEQAFKRIDTILRQDDGCSTPRRSP